MVVGAKHQRTGESRTKKVIKGTKKKISKVQRGHNEGLGQAHGESGK